jgi:hypothetical protein
MFTPSELPGKLARFRIDWSADVSRIAFGSPDDPDSPVGFHTVGDLLRLHSPYRLRQLSQGPTVESFGFEGTGSGRSDLRLAGRSLRNHGMSGPYTHELALSEVGRLLLLPGGAAALFGPNAASGAVLAERSFPVQDEPLSRAVGEEGVDGYERAGFRLARRVGSSGALFVSTEGRRMDGFFAGTKEVDRFLSGEYRRALPGGMETSVSWREFEGDGEYFDLVDNDLATVRTKRTDLVATLFRPAGEGKGALVELALTRAKVERVAWAWTGTRTLRVPSITVTGDLPRLAGADWTGRVETARREWTPEDSTSAQVGWTGAAALRGSMVPSPGARVTATVRGDLEERRRGVFHARLESEWTRGRWTAFGIASRSERPPGPGAADPATEVSRGARLGGRYDAGPVEAGGTLFGTVIDRMRPGQNFNDLRSRLPVTADPEGTGEIAGGTLWLRVHPCPLPWFGEFRAETSATATDANLRETGTRLAGRPRLTWTGEMSLERRFLDGEVRTSAIGRLTHYRDRTDLLSSAVTDAWITDVVLRGEIGDAIFFYRLHDLLERADEVEPGIRLPGFSFSYGISWRFIG